MKKLIFAFVGLISLSASADVWVEKETWDAEWEAKFSEWVKTQNVNKDMFVSPASKYKGVVADCADVSYNFRVIFAFENGLAFSAKNPMATSTSKMKHFTNRMTMFDNVQDPHKRVVAFMNYLGKSLGTETLAASDSYPMKLSEIKAGDVYLYKTKMADKFVRHTYNFKNIDRRGNFEVIYSTQAIRDSGAPMNQKVKAMYNPPVAYKWGFRRYDYGVSAKPGKTTQSQTYSDEQFVLAQQMDSNKFFNHVKSLLRQEVESPEDLIKNQLKELCGQVKERIEIVNRAITYKSSISNKCMEYADFDTHSTPSRDGRLKEIMTNLDADFKDVNKKDLTLETTDLVEAIFNSTPTQYQLDRLMAYCPISYKAGTTVSLREIRIRSSKGLLSSHPNDSLENRWGEKSNGKTKCEAFY